MSQEIERLTRQCELGDRDAARRLWELARRHDDVDRALLAAETLDDAERLTVIALGAWDAGHFGRLERAARALGFGLDATARKAIEAALKRANGRRRKFRLGPRGVLEAIVAARHAAHGVGVSHGGLERWSTAGTRSTFCVAVYEAGRDRITLGIEQTWAIDKATPGRIWRELGPWQRDLSRNRKRAHAWAARTRPTHEERVQIQAIGPAPEPLLPKLRGMSKAARRRVTRLEGFLEDDPSPGVFRSLLALLNRWPLRDRDVAAARVEATLADWPDAARAVDQRWVEDAHARDEPRPFDHLIRALDAELLPLLEPRSYHAFKRLLSETLSHPSLARVTHLTLRGACRERFRPHLDLLDAALPLRHLGLHRAVWSEAHAQRLLEGDIAFAHTLTSFETRHGIDRVGLGLHLRFAARFPHLRRLDVSNTPLAAPDVLPATVRVLPELRELALARLTLPAEVFEALALRRPELTHLDLRGTRPTVAITRALTRFPVLSSLRLRGYQLSAGAAEALASMPALDTLEISDTRISPAILERLSDAPNLRHLNLDDTMLGEDAARILASAPGFSTLESLSLAGHTLTVAARRALADSDSLRAELIGVPGLFTHRWKALRGD